MFIVRLGHHSLHHDAADLSAVTLSVTAAICWLLVAASAAAAGDDGSLALAHDLRMFLAPWCMPQCTHGLQLLYLSTVSTLAGWLQTWGQARVRPHEAVIIYTMDPVYAAIFARVLLGEQLHTLGYVGIGLTLMANALRQIPWETWDGTRDLVTPRAGAKVLHKWGLDSKGTPLLWSSEAG